MNRSVVVSLLAISLAACASKQTPKPTTTEPLVEQGPGPTTPVEEESVTTTEPGCDDVEAAWPMFQRSPLRNGATEVAAIQTPRLAWSQKTGIAGWLNNPIIAGDAVFAPSSGLVWNKPDGSDGVYSLGLADGEVRWFHPTEDDANAVAYDRCRVYVTSDDGAVTALDAADGEVIWKRAFDHKMYANPLPLDDVVVVGGAAGKLVALNVEDGEPKWSADVGAAIRGGASASPALVFVGTEAGRLFAVDRETGDVSWEQTVPRSSGDPQIYGAPTIHEGLVIVGYSRDTSYSTPAIAAMRVADGEPVWVGKNSEGFQGGWGNIRSSPGIWNERLFWGEPYSNRIVSASTVDGDTRQSVAAGFCMFPHWPSPAIASGVAYVGRHDGGLYALDTESGAVLWRQYVGDRNSISADPPPEFVERGAARCQWEPPFGSAVYASPAIASDGTVVVATGDGWVHAFRDEAQ